jgi:hypothetical protein
MEQRAANARSSSMSAIVKGGLVAGTLDIGAAALINGVSPAFIVRFVAGGLLGKDALAGGVPVAVLGFALQLVMSLLIAAVYVGVARRFEWLGRHWLAAGLAYGVVVFFVMNYVVMPLSAWARWPRFTPATFGWNMLAMLVFGIIVAFFARQLAATSPGAEIR